MMERDEMMEKKEGGKMERKKRKENWSNELQWIYNLIIEFSGTTKETMDF